MVKEIHFGEALNLGGALRGKKDRDDRRKS